MLAGLASQLAVVIRRRMQPGLEQLQSATLRETRVEDLTLGAFGMMPRHTLPTPSTRAHVQCL